MPNQQSSSIAQRFEQLKQDGRFALMPFLMAGDPDLALTADVLLSLQSAGADMVELGMPYSSLMGLSFRPQRLVLLLPEPRQRECWRCCGR